MIGKMDFINVTKKTIRNCLGQVCFLAQTKRRDTKSSSPAHALQWIRTHAMPFGGIRVHSEHAGAYPEVTGYLVPTLLDYGERDLAIDCVRWLMCVQRGDGAFCDPDHAKPHVFDTGQVLRGLLAGGGLVPGGMDAARRAADLLCLEMTDEGRGGFGARYGGLIPESIHLYALPPLFQAADVFGEEKYRTAAGRCLDFYCRHEDFLCSDALTHFLAYQFDALIDLGRAELARPVLDDLAREQRDDGSIRGIGGARWVCTPGLAQVAICWYKLDQWDRADRAMAWLESRQRPSGGFYGSYGFGATYFPKQELPWAAKYFLDAHRYRVRSFIHRSAADLPSQVPSDDGRIKALLELICPGDRVAEIGCGKGRFLRAIREAFPQNACTGVDIAPALLREVPADIIRIESPMEILPLASDRFDLVFAVESVEHSANPGAAVAEMVRIAKPGGRVVVIDKQQSHWGRLACPPWERWPTLESMKSLLGRGCDDVAGEPVAYDAVTAPDGLMVLWKGRKRSLRMPGEVGRAGVGKAGQKAVLERAYRHQIFPWAQEILLATRPGDRVLEVGSGTGEISLALALAGRQVTIVDISQESLDFTHQCALELGARITAVRGDAARGMPELADGQFDCVWSAGLLEHFAAEERRFMLREWARLTTRHVIALVPSATCLAYRVGKRLQEEAGTWPYGRETPLASLREDFEAVGLRVETEYTVGTKAALAFLPRRHSLRIALAAQFEGKTEYELGDLNQGYLLLAKGVKAAHE